ncbi:MAG: cation acetate symporter [Candidatus Cloacimonadaceae bacterium]|nr:cation acetate symporter [Candidatus Cloacimonadaceae bacterium]MDP3113738.1 cation acetate symporter [Candidatus Cloacimonadaceae bacterium]
MENLIAVIIVVGSIIVSLIISFLSVKSTKTTKDFYVAGGKISWKLNGAAMFGDYCSAASFLGVAGAVALYGIDGWWLALGFFSAWIVILLVLAGPLKKAGKFTVGDILSSRFSGNSIKVLAMLTTAIIGTLYLVPQIVGAGHLFNLLLGWNYLTTVFLSGGFIALMVVVGGMKGTTINQAIQGGILLAAMLFLLFAAALLYYNGNPLNMISEATKVVPPKIAMDVAADVIAAAPKETVKDAVALTVAVRNAAPDAPSALTPGIDVKGIWNQLSLALGLLLGTAGLPHILIRFFTVKSSKDAQKGAEMTIVGLAIFYFSVLFVGLAAMKVMYPTLISLVSSGEIGKATNMAVPLLGKQIGGEVLLGIIAAGAMAAMLSTSVGLLISMTTSISHDLYAGILRPHSSDKERVRFAKIGTVVFALLAILASIWLKNQNVAVLVGMVFGIAASTFAPIVLLTLWWKKLSKKGVLWGLSIGLILSLIFTFAKFLNIPYIYGIKVLINPALYVSPIVFAVTIFVSLQTKDKGHAEKFMAMTH